MELSSALEQLGEELDTMAEKIQELEQHSAHVASRLEAEG